MSYRILLCLLVTSALLVAACNGGRRGGTRPRDGGPEDTGVADSGSDGIVLMDTGTTPECDTARPCPVGQTCVAGMCQATGCTSSSECPTGQSCVGGMCQTTSMGCTSSSMCPAGNVCVGGSCVPDSTRVCEGSNIPYNALSICSASTETCISGCADGMCIQDCLDADPSPDCSSCVNQNLLSCFNDAGCQTRWDPYVCCIEDQCGTMATTTCANSARMGACASQYSAWDSCTMTADIETVCPSGGWLYDCF